MKHADSIVLATLALLWIAPHGIAQTAPATEKPTPTSVQTFHLANVNEPHEVDEVITALRNMAEPQDKIYLLPAQNSIVMNAGPDQLLLAQKLLKELDQPKKTYRLTYTIAEAEDDKPVGSQHFAIIVVSGGRTVFKNGSKVPIVTGSSNAGAASSKTDITYLDLGLNIDASLNESANGVRLRTKVERSSIAEEKSGIGAEDPVIRQLVMEGTSILIPGKQVMLGSLDAPGSTRNLEVSVVLSVLP